MEHTIKVYGCLCNLSEFTINGIEADKEDFGDQEDRDPSSAEPYGCGNMQFRMNKRSHPDILSKYGISEKEYAEIGEELEEKLSFGQCGWCV